MSKAWAGGSSRRWRNLRAMVLQRDGYRCRAHWEGWCTRPGVLPHTCNIRVTLHGSQAGEAHHTLGKARTGDDPAHIVTACKPCNRAIGDPAAAPAVPDQPPSPRTDWSKQCH